MTTDTHLVSAALEAAEAIVEAEWMRLTRDWNQWECEFAEFVELRSPRPRPPRGHTTIVASRPTALPPRRISAWYPARRSPAPTVWATQRSPPAATPGPTIDRCSRVMEVVMP
jgi:hypothetical protein